MWKVEGVGGLLFSRFVLLIFFSISVQIREFIVLKNWFLKLPKRSSLEFMEIVKILMQKKQGSKKNSSKSKNTEKISKFLLSFGVEKKVDQNSKEFSTFGKFRS